MRKVHEAPANTASKNSRNLALCKSKRGRNKNKNETNNDFIKWLVVKKHDKSLKEIKEHFSL